MVTFVFPFSGPTTSAPGGFSKYPAAIDDNSSLPITTDLVTQVRAEVVNRQRSSIIATQQELGVQPSGVFGTVTDRLLNVDSRINSIIEAGGFIGPSTINAVTRFSGVKGQTQNSLNGPFVLDNGNFGVGTATPSVPLDVIGAASISGAITVGAAASVTDAITVGESVILTAQTVNPAGILNSGKVFTKIASEFPVIRDASSGGNDGTATNMEIADITSDTPGGVSGFSASFGPPNFDEHVIMTDVLDFDHNVPFTVMCWAKTVDDNGYLVSKADGTVRGWGLHIDGAGALQFIFLTNSTTGIQIRTVTGIFNDNTWHHFAISYSGNGLASGVTLYVDGAVETKAAPVLDNLASGTTVNAAALQINGRTGANEVLSAQIDDVAIYDTDLTLAQVVAIYNSGAPRDNTLLASSSNLVGYWLMGDSTELFYLDSSGTAIQITGGGALVVSTTGTDEQTWTVNEDAATSPFEYARLSLLGPDSGSNLYRTQLLHSPIDEVVYLTFSENASVNGNTSRTTQLTLGPWVEVDSTADNVDSRLLLRGHRSGDAIDAFWEIDMHLDVSARNFNWNTFPSIVPTANARGVNHNMLAHQGGASDDTATGGDGGRWRFDSGKGGNGAASFAGGDGGDFQIFTGDGGNNGGGGEGLPGDMRLDTGLSPGGVGGSILIGDTNADLVQVGGFGSAIIVNVQDANATAYRVQKSSENFILIDTVGDGFPAGSDKLFLGNYTCEHELQLVNGDFSTVVWRTGAAANELILEVSMDASPSWDFMPFASGGHAGADFRFGCTNSSSVFSAVNEANQPLLRISAAASPGQVDIGGNIGQIMNLQMNDTGIITSGGTDNLTLRPGSNGSLLLQDDSGTHGITIDGSGEVSIDATSAVTITSPLFVDSATVAENYFDLEDGNTAPVSAANHVRLRSNAGVFEVSEGGGAYVSPVGGTGTDNNMVVWDGTGATAIKDSFVLVDATDGGLLFTANLDVEIGVFPFNQAAGAVKTLTIRGQNNPRAAVQGGDLDLIAGQCTDASKPAVVGRTFIANGSVSDAATAASIEITNAGNIAIDVRNNSTANFNIGRGAGVGLLDLTQNRLMILGTARALEFSNSVTSAVNFIRPEANGSQQTLTVHGQDWSSGATDAGDLVLRGGNATGGGADGDLIFADAGGLTRGTLVGTNWTFNPGSSTTFQVGGSPKLVIGTTSFFRFDANQSAAFMLQDTSFVDYLNIDTSGEIISFGNTANAPAYDFLGAGEVTIDGAALGLTEQADDPGGNINTGKLYTKDGYEATELFYQDSSGFVAQLTSTGTTKASNGVTTTNDTITNLFTFATVTNTSMQVVAHVAIRSTTDGDSGSSLLVATFENTDGYVTQVGITSPVHETAEDATWGTVQTAPVVFDVDGANIEVLVEGGAGDEVEWLGWLNVTRTL